MNSEQRCVRQEWCLIVGATLMGWALSDEERGWPHAKRILEIALDDDGAGPIGRERKDAGEFGTTL